MKHVDAVVNTNSKRGRLDAMNDGLRSLLDPYRDGQREVHCARFDHIQDGLFEIEDEYASGPYYVFFCEWSQQEELINPMNLKTKSSLWLQDHHSIRSPIAFVRASHTIIPASVTFGQSTRRTVKTYHFKDILDMPRTNGNAKLNEMICKRSNNPLAKVLYHEPDGCDECGPVDTEELQWTHAVTAARNAGLPILARNPTRTD